MCATHFLHYSGTVVECRVCVPGAWRGKIRSNVWPERLARGRSPHAPFHLRTKTKQLPVVQRNLKTKPGTLKEIKARENPTNPYAVSAGLSNSKKKINMSTPPRSIIKPNLEHLDFNVY